MVVGVPTGYIGTGSNSWISIPHSLMVTQDGNGNTIEPRYANVHVQKSYILNAVSQHRIGHTEDDILAQNNAETYNPLFRDSSAAATGSNRNTVDDVSAAPPLDSDAEITIASPVLQPPSIESIFREIDVDQSGQLDIEEFKSWWRQTGGNESQVPLFEECFEVIGARDGISGVSLLEFKEVIGAVAANDWLEKRSEAHDRSYWWNQRTGESTWTDPGGADQLEACVQEWLRRMEVQCYETVEV